MIVNILVKRKCSMLSSIEASVNYSQCLKLNLAAPSTELRVLDCASQYATFVQFQQTGKT